MSREAQIAVIEEARQSIINTLNMRFNRLIASLGAIDGTDGQTTDNHTDGSKYETTADDYIVPITANPIIFIGKKPVAVVLGDVTKDAKSWREVLTTVLEHCNQDPLYHERLMELRGRIAGNFRIFLSDKPDGMSKAVKIDDALYVEVHHGAQAMMYTLVSKILSAIQYDCSNISVIMKSGYSKRH